MSLVACAQGEGGWEQKHYRLEVETKRLQPVDEKRKKIFARKKYFFRLQQRKSLKPSHERLAPVLALQCLTLVARARLRLASALDTDFRYHLCLDV